LERLLESVGPGLESLSLAIRQSEQLWGDGTYHLCHILSQTSSNLKSLHIGEEDSYSRCIRSMSCCRDLFDLAKWENLVDCHLCVYPGRGGCLDQSEGSLNALVESARAVAMRNSLDLGTIIRIKGILISYPVVRILIIFLSGLSGITPRRSNMAYTNGFGNVINLRNIWVHNKYIL
jgi:hypothetical protein